MVSVVPPEGNGGGEALPEVGENRQQLVGHDALEAREMGVVVDEDVKRVADGCPDEVSSEEEHGP